MPSPDQIPPEIFILYKPTGTIYGLKKEIVIKSSASDVGNGLKTLNFYWGKSSGTYNVKIITEPINYPPEAGPFTTLIEKENLTSDCTIYYYFTAKDKAMNWKILDKSPSGGTSSEDEPVAQPFAVEVKSTKYSFIPASGGEILFADANPDDGISGISIPAGALTSGATIAITWEDPDNFSGEANFLIGSTKPVSVFNFGPSGQTFEISPVIRLLYPNINSDDKIDGTEISETDLRIFGWDGFKWRPLASETFTHTETDEAKKNTVETRVRHFSKFAIFETGAPLSAADTRPMRKIITPNTDLRNDYAEFTGLAPPYTLNIYNLRGRSIKKITEIPNPIWKGDDKDGDTVESGIYIYQIEKNGKIISGVIVVAK